MLELIIINVIYENVEKPTLFVPVELGMAMGRVKWVARPNRPALVTGGFVSWSIESRVRMGFKVMA